MHLCSHMALGAVVRCSDGLVANAADIAFDAGVRWRGHVLHLHVHLLHRVGQLAHLLTIAVTSSLAATADLEVAGQTVDVVFGD